MSGALSYVENLTDAELYDELKKRGFTGGPVVGKCITCTLLKVWCW
jgi:hypothetical protein